MIGGTNSSNWYLILVHSEQRESFSSYVFYTKRDAIAFAQDDLDYRRSQFAKASMSPALQVKEGLDDRW